MKICFRKDMEMFSTEGIGDSTIIGIGFVGSSSISLKIFRTDYTAKYQFVSVNENTGHTCIVEGYPRKIYSYRFVFKKVPNTPWGFGTFFKTIVCLIKKVKEVNRDDIICLTPEEAEKRRKELIKED